eukprot:4607093-Pyramimonas_sp.AAC.1
MLENIRQARRTSTYPPRNDLDLILRSDCMAQRVILIRANDQTMRSCEYRDVDTDRLRMSSSGGQETCEGCAET